MDNADRTTADRQTTATDRLDDLERRLAAAFGRLSGRGGAAAQHEGETLQARRARLREQMQDSGGPSVLGEIEALTNAVDEWVSRVDQDERRAQAKDGSPH